MINLKQELQNYPYIDLNSLAKDTAEIPDPIKNSVFLYNKALDNLRANSEDIAIIELKKAVSMNPDFFEAMNLLGVCYVYTKQYAKASEMFQKVVSVENNGIKALEYLNDLQSQANCDMPHMEKKKNQVDKIEKSNSNENHKASPNPNHSVRMTAKSSLIKYVTCFIAGVLVFLILNAIFASGKKDLKTSAPVAVPPTNNEYELKYRQLSESYKKLEEELKAAENEVDYYKNVGKLMEAENLSLAKDYINAGDKLVLLKSVNFKEAEKGKFDALYRDVMPKAAWAAFGQGTDLFAQGQYKEALNQLSKIQTYGNEWEYMDVTLYKIGICYKELNDSRNALDIFRKVKETYPNSQYAVYAGYRMNELTGAP